MKRRRSLRTRVETLEKQSQLEGEEEQTIEVVLRWPEDPLYRQSVARATQARAQGGKEVVVVRWTECTRVKPP